MRARPLDRPLPDGNRTKTLEGSAEIHELRYGYEAVDITYTWHLTRLPDADCDGIPNAQDRGLTPPVCYEACDTAEATLAKAKRRLKKLRAHDAPNRAVKKAKRRVRKATWNVAEAC